jgi:hypothetical protein
VTAVLLFLGGVLSLVGVRNMRGADPNETLVKPT